MDIPEAAIATSVPEIPIENPISAILSAGPSFVPSPVTATTSPASFNIPTSNCLSSEKGEEEGKEGREKKSVEGGVPVGEERASTCRRGRAALRSSSDISRNTGPSKQIPPGLKIPQDLAIFWAVTMSIEVINNAKGERDRRGEVWKEHRREAMVERKKHTVSSNHAHSNSSALACRDGARDFGTKGVTDTDERDEC